MMKKLIGISLALLCLNLVAAAQEQLSIKQQADKLFDRYEYYKSLNLYLKLADNDSTQLAILQRIATCYLSINQYHDAEVWYAKVMSDPKANLLDHLNYAGVLMREQKFELAKEQYKLAFANGDAELTLKLSDCDSAKLWMKEASPYKIANTNGFNTEYSDWGLNYDGTAGYIFTSDRPVNGETDNRTGNSWFKLYISAVKSKEVKPFVITNAIVNKSKGSYHIGPLALNRSADTAYITMTTEATRNKLDADKKDWQSKQQLYSRRLQLVIAVKRHDQWIIIGNFPYDNIQKYSISSAALSNNGNILYFASDMPGGRGKTDIWYSEKAPDGSWGKPVNCGGAINTGDDDDFPFIAPDGTLFYASKGLPGMGGYDIYQARGEKANWTTPRNLKYPVNTTSDDFCLVTHDGVNGYLSSNREDGTGSDDIYAFMPNPAKINVSETVAANSPVIGLNLVFEPIYYDLNKYDIRPDATVVLNKLVAVLKQYPKIKISISSYTDSRATADYNIALSQRRATAAAEYLISKGIDANRLFANWFGETDLVNDCPDGVLCTEAQHQLNRRTEFKVITASK